eukprot:9444258-Ditylum_brightwellii.AAC.1
MALMMVKIIVKAKGMMMVLIVVGQIEASKTNDSEGIGDDDGVEDGVDDDDDVDNGAVDGDDDIVGKGADDGADDGAEGAEKHL